jgi:hypothetical protein
MINEKQRFSLRCNSSLLVMRLWSDLFFLLSRRDSELTQDLSLLFFTFYCFPFCPASDECVNLSQSLTFLWKCYQ